MPAGYGYGRGFGLGGFGVGGFGVGGGPGGGPVQYLPISYYLNLLTSEYQTSPKLLAYGAVLLQPLDDISQCLLSFAAAIDIDLATGALLDLRGQIVGQSRTVGFQPSNGVSPVLDDTTYRLLLKARIAQNHWNGQIDGLQAIWQQLFPGGQIVIEDAQNMTATILVRGAFSSIEQDLIRNGYIVPRPQAVLYTISFAALPALGFDQNTSEVAGADLGHFAS